LRAAFLVAFGEMGSDFGTVVVVAIVVVVVVVVAVGMVRVGGDGMG
jgi:hypothetical protein